MTNASVLSPAVEPVPAAHPEHGRSSLVICAGLHSSASTWVFNVVRALLQLSSPTLAVVSLYSDNIDQEQDALIRSAPAAVVKTHAASHSLIMLARLARLPVILTIRDPRDSVASLMQRFAMSFDVALNCVATSAPAMMQVLSQCSPLLLRYEDCFATKASGIKSIAHVLSIDIDSRSVEELAEDHSPAAVNALIERFQFDGVFDGTQPANQWDNATQWHPRHVGDGRVGKFQDILTPNQIAVVEHATVDYMRVFGYPAVDRRMDSGTSLSFGMAGIGFAYLSNGFSTIEHWGAWTDATVANVGLVLSRRPAKWLSLQSDWLVGPVLRSSSNEAVAEIALAGRVLTRLNADPHAPERVRLVFFVEASALPDDGRIPLTLRFQGLRSPAELDPSATDGRKLGLGIIRITVEYI